MVNYGVSFVEEPVISFSADIREVAVSYKSMLGEELGFDVGNKMNINRGNISVTIREADFTEEEFSQVLERFNDRINYGIKLRLGDLQAIAEEVISKDTGVDVKGRLRVRVDWFVYKVGVQLLEDKFTEEELGQLGEYSTEDRYGVASRVIKNYYKDLGNKGEDRELTISKEDVGEDMDEYCTVIMSN